MSHQADERKEPQQHGGGPRNRFIGPLALGFQAQMSATFFKGDLPGKGLARYRAQGSARLQPLPIRTAREVFPQAAHPVSFVERVMGRLGHEGHFHENCSALGSGWIFQSQYRPSTSYKYSLLHRRHPMFRLRLSIYPSSQLLQTDGCLYHFTPASP